MNITELDNFKITNAINFNDNLNPQLYLGELMRRDVHKKLMDIANNFSEFLGIENLALVDITLSGSNAAYSYTPHSDVDLHLIVDFTQLPDNDVYKELFDAKKYQYNDQHDIKVKGYDVELYVQDSNQPHVSLGTYSVLNNDWVRFPTKQRVNLDDNATKLKYEKLKDLAIRALAADSEEYLNNVLDIVKRYRRAGLSQNGEFGPENLAFKVLRKEGYFEKLWAKKRSHIDTELSMEHIDDGEEDDESDLEQELSSQFRSFGQPGKRTAESVIKELYSESESLFDDYDFATLHEAASNLMLLPEAAYEGNIGMTEVFQFYQNATPGEKSLITRLLRADKQNEAWQLIQKVSGTQLQGKPFQAESESYQPPEIEVGDEVKVGKFKNRKATVKGFKTDKDNQPVLKTNKGEHKLFKPRISKLENELEEGVGIIVKDVNTTADVGVGQTKIEADKLNLDCDVDGRPEIPANGVPARLYEGIVNELDMSPGKLQKQVNSIIDSLAPVIGLELEVCIKEDEEANPEVTAYTDIQDLKDYFSETSDDDDAWAHLEMKWMDWVMGEKEPEWVEEQVDDACKTPYYNDREKVEFMQNFEPSDEANDFIAEISGDEEDIEFTEELAKETIAKAQAAYKKWGTADTWQVQESSPAHLKLYYDIFIDDPDDAKEMLKELFEPDFWESEFPGSNDYSIGAWFLKDQVQSFREVGREIDGLYSEHGSGPEGYHTGGFSYDAAQNIAGGLDRVVGAEVDVIEEDETPSLHSWSIVMDSSIKPDKDDDAGMEIITPPLPYVEGLIDIENTIEYLLSNGAYTNSSTGLHVNVSLENVDHSRLDYAKLIVMLGDSQILKQYGREFNEYAVNSLRGLSDLMNPNTGYAADKEGQAKSVAMLMSKMRTQISGAVSSSFSNLLSLGKYASVGFQDNRIEFRSPGGADYLNDFDMLLATINRFIAAYAAACDPEAYKKEYGKKLYKLASNASEGTAEKSSMTLFAAFGSGIIDKETLVQNLRDKATSRKRADQIDRGEAIDTDDLEAGDAIEMIAHKHSMTRNDVVDYWIAGLDIEEVNGREDSLSRTDAEKIVFKRLMNNIGYYK